METVWIVLFWVVVAGLIGYRLYRGPSKRHISEAGDRSGRDGVLKCPNCGGTQFKAKRSAGAKVGLGLTIGLGAFLAPKTRVKCITCGQEFLRG